MVVGAVDELEVGTFRDALLGAMARAPGTRARVAEGRPARQALELLGLYEYAATGRQPHDLTGGRKD